MACGRGWVLAGCLAVLVSLSAASTACAQSCGANLTAESTYSELVAILVCMQRQIATMARELEQLRAADAERAALAERVAALESAMARQAEQIAEVLSAAESVSQRSLEVSSGTSATGLLDPIQVTVAEIGAEERERFSISEGVAGLVVTNVAQGTSAALRDLRIGDVIVQVSQVGVTTVAGAQRLIDAQRNEQRSSVLFMINRRGNLRFLAIELSR